MTWKLAVVCAVVGLLGACSPAPESYASGNAVVAALRAEGIICTDYSAGEEAELLSDRGSCTSGEDAIDIYVFDDDADRDRWLAVGAGLSDVVIGPNWVVQAAGQADEVADALGGDNP